MPNVNLPDIQTSPGAVVDTYFVDIPSGLIGRNDSGLTEPVNAANWPFYAFPTVDAQNVGLYAQQMPPIQAGTYTRYARLRLGTDPDPNDVSLGADGPWVWDGSNLPPVQPGGPPGGYDHYPTGADLEGFLAGSGMVIPDGQDLDSAAEAGREHFESMTDRIPMLATADTRYFDLNQVNNQSILDLQADIVSVTSLKVQGKPFILNQDFYLHPNDAPNRRRPYGRIKFNIPWAFYAAGPMPPEQFFRAIVIEGAWGYWPTIPADAWRAMLRAAALDLVFGGIDPGDGTGPIPAFLKSWTAISRSSATYDMNFFWDQRKEWWNTLDKTVNRYQRIMVG